MNGETMQEHTITRSRRAAAALLATTLLAGVLTLVTATDASAAPPLPEATLSVPTSAFIGDEVSFTVAFDNADATAAGYGPYVDLWMPVTGVDGAGIAVDDGLTFGTATYLGTPVTAIPITLTSCSGAQLHPFTGLPILCPTGFRVGDQIVVLELPFGSFSPGQPSASISVTAQLSDLADLAVPLPVAAVAGFRYGSTPTGNTPIVQDPPATAEVEPVLVTMAKDYLGPEDETATGPNFPRAYRLSLAVAPGQEITDLDVTDLLPDNVVYLGVDSIDPAGSVTTEPPDTTDPHNPTDNEVTVNIPTVTGTGAGDVTVDVSFYVPDLDANGDPVISPTTGDDATSLNEASVLGDWDPIDARDAGGTDNVTAAATHELTPKSIAVQKGVAQVLTDVGAPGPSPGDTLAWTIDFQVSDYFTFGDVSLHDVFTDGQTLDPRFPPTLRFDDDDDAVSGDLPPTAITTSRADAPCGDGATTMDLDVSGAVAAMSGGTDGVLTGGLATGGDTGPTTGTVTFRTVIDSNYRCLDAGNPLDSRDRLTNDVTIAGEVLDNGTQASQATPAFEDDDSRAGVTIVAPSLRKTIYARNGDLPGDPNDLSLGLANRAPFAPGDSITYRLTAEVPLTNVESLRLEDYLPLPVLSAAGFSTTFDATANPAGALPAVGSARLGSLDTFTATSGLSPTVAVDTVSNLLTLTYGDYQAVDGESSAVIDVLLRLPISDDPFVDGLYLTNQARLWSANSFSDAAPEDAIIQIELTQPVLRVTKGVVGSDNPAATFSPATVGPVPFTVPAGSTTPPRWTGTVSSAGLAAQPMNSDITGGVDAGDLVTHAIVVENTGSGLQGAFDVRIADTIPVGYEVPATAAELNLQVTDGAGTALAYTDLGGGLFGTGIELVDDTSANPDVGSLAPYAATGGANLAVVTYNLRLDHTTDPDPVRANQALTNTAAVTNYAGAEDAADHLGTGSLSDTATVRTAAPAITKTITGTDQTHTAGNDAAIGEQVSYAVRVRVPEGRHPSFTVTDTLPAGLAFVSFDSASASGALATTAASGDWSAAGVLPAVTPADGGAATDGRIATWDFGTVTNTDGVNATGEEIVLTYTVAVTNVAVNQDGRTRLNTVTTSFGGSGQAPLLTIREPDVRVAKSVDPTRGDAGDAVRFTLSVANTAGTADAFDVRLEDVVPTGFTYVPGSFTHTAGVAPDAGPEDGTRPTLTAGWDHLTVGQTSTLTFDAVIDADIDVDLLAAGLTNAADVDYSSLPGAQTATTAVANAFGVERTGDVTEIGGTANDHRHRDDATVTVAPTRVDKAVAATSEVSTDAAAVTIGEVVSYDVVVDLPEGDVGDWSILDAVPAGMAYIGGSAQIHTSHPLLTADFGGTLGAATVAPTGDGADGQDVTVDIGASRVTAGDPDDNAVVLSLDLLVLDVVANRGDDPTTGADESTALVNTATVTVVGTPTTSAPATVTVVEPRLAITKVFSPDHAAANDTVAVTLVVTNGGTSTAFDVVVTDLLEGDVFPAADVVEGTTPAGFTYATAPEGDNDTRLTYTGGDLAVGGSATFSFLTTLADPLAVPGSVVNTAVVSQATTLPADHPGGQGAERDEPDVSGQDELVFTAPDLRVVKDDGVQVRSPGDAYDYTITVHNDGGRDATGVLLSDTLPDGLGFDGASDSGTESGGLVTWPAFSLAAGAVRAFTVSVAVDAPLAEGITEFLNRADVVDDGTHGPDPDLADNTDSDLDTTDAAVDVAVTKDDGQQTRNPGEQYTYTLRVTNQGNQGESGITLTDSLPPGLRFDAASDGGTESGGEVTWPAFALAGGASTSRTVTVTVADPLSPGIGEVLNQAAVDSPDDANPANNADRDTDLVEAAPDLRVTKDDGETVVAPGEVLTYEVVVTNVGSQGATGITLSDTLPAGVAFDGASDGGTEAGGVVTWPAFDLAGRGGTVAYTVTVVVDDPITAVELVNTATVTDDGRNGLDPTPDDNRATDTDRSVPDLRVVKDDGTQTRVPGEQYDYTITVHNDGGVDATGVTLTDHLPAEVAFVAASDAGTPDGAPVGGDVGWDLGRVPAGGSISVTVTVAVLSPVPNGTTQVQNRADAGDDGANGPDPTPGNNLDQDTDAVEATIDVGVVKDDGVQTRRPGQRYTYSLVVTNHGDEDAVDVALRDTLPAGLAFDAASDGGTEAGGVVTWPLFDLAGDGATVTYTVTVLVDDPLAAGIDEVRNGARVATPGDADRSNDTDVDTDTIESTPDLAVVKDDGETVVAPGQQLTYTLLVTNAGDQDATGVALTDTLPEGVGFDGASDGGTEADGIVTWPLFDLAGAGATATRTVTVSVNDPLRPGLLDLPNGATVGDDGTNGVDPTPEDNSASDTDLTIGDLRLVKDDGVQTRTPGEGYTYTVIVHNDGGAAVTGATLVDTLPAQLVFVDASDGGSHDGSAFGGAVTWDLGTIAGGSQVARTVDVTVRRPVPNGTFDILNTAEVDHDEVDGPDPTPGNNLDQDTDAVEATIDVGVVKDDGVQTRRPGQRYTYSLVVTNHGDEDAVDVALRDTLPAGLAFDAASDGGTEAGGVVTWPLFDLAGDGATVTYTVTVVVDDPLAAGIETVVNGVTVSTPRDVDPDNDSDSDTDDIEATPDLSVVKDDGQTTAVEGESLTYTVVVTNAGDQDATGVVLTDTLPEGVAFVGASDGGSEAGGAVTWPAFDLAGAGATATRTVTVSVNDPLPQGTTSVVNTASVLDDGTNGDDPTPEDNTATDTDVTGADLWVTKVAETDVATPGETASWLITVGNDGPEAVEAVLVDEQLPAEVADPVFEPSEGAFDPATGEWTGLSLAPGDTVTLRVTVTVDTTARLPQDNAVSVVPRDHADPDLSDNDADAPIRLEPEIDLSVAKTAIGAFRRGEVGRWRITVTNVGPSAVGRFRIVDDLPRGLTYRGVEDAAAWNCVAEGQRVECLSGLLQPGASRELVLLTEVADDIGGSLVNLVTVSASEEGAPPEVFLTDNDAEATVRFGPPPADAGPPTTLPRTGTDVLLPVLCALALLLGGGLVRRRGLRRAVSSSG